MQMKIRAIILSNMQRTYSIMTLLVMGGLAVILALSSEWYGGLWKGEKTAGVAESREREIHLLFAVDIMLSRSIGQLLQIKRDYLFPFRNTATTTQAADIAFANLENPVSTGGIRSGSIYSFKADPKALEGVKFGGFDVVSIANNHIWDYGKQAFNDTLGNLSKNGIVAVGGGANYTEAHSPKILTVGKTRFAFLAYTNLIAAFLGTASSTPAVSRYNDKILKADITHAKELADFIIISFHWGDEYHTTHNVEQERIAKFVIDAGANLVVGHHPHVTQEVERYKSGYIFYSLGNFIFDQNFSKDTEHGLTVEVTVKGSNITNVRKREVTFNADFQPHLTGEAW